MQYPYYLLSFCEEVLFWKQQSTKIIPSLSPYTIPYANFKIVSYACHPNGFILLSNGQIVLLYSLQTGKYNPLELPINDNIQVVKALEIIDGTCINNTSLYGEQTFAIVCYSGGLLAIYDINNGCAIYLTHKFSYEICFIKSSHDYQETTVLTTQNALVCLWDLKSNKVSESLQIPGNDVEVSDIEFSVEDPRIFALARKDNTVHVLSLEASSHAIKLLYTYDGSAHRTGNRVSDCRSIAFSPSNEYLLLSANLNGYFTCYDAVSHKIILNHDTGYNLESVGISQDAYTIVFGTGSCSGSSTTNRGTAGGPCHDSGCIHTSLLLYDLRSHKGPKEIIDIKTHPQLPDSSYRGGKLGSSFAVQTCFAKFNQEFKNVFNTETLDEAKTSDLHSSGSINKRAQLSGYNANTANRAIKDPTLSPKSDVDIFDESVCYISPIKMGVNHTTNSDKTNQQESHSNRINDELSSISSNLNHSKLSTNPTPNIVNGYNGIRGSRETFDSLTTSSLNRGRISVQSSDSETIPKLKTDLPHSMEASKATNRSIPNGRCNRSARKTVHDLLEISAAGTIPPDVANIDLPTKYSTKQTSAGDTGCERLRPPITNMVDYLKEELNNVKLAMHNDIINLHMDTIKGFHEIQVQMRQFSQVMRAQQNEIIGQLVDIRNVLNDRSDQNNILYHN